MQTATNNNDSTKYYRFQVFQGDADKSGKVNKTKSVGMAYLRDGQNIYTLRLQGLYDAGNAATVSQKRDLERKVTQADLELKRLVKLQIQSDDQDLREIYSAQLKELKAQRDADSGQLEQVKREFEDSISAAAMRRTVETNLKLFQKAWAKATPALQKKLIRSVIQRLVFRPDGIDIYYHSDLAQSHTIQSKQDPGSTGAQPVDLAVPANVINFPEKRRRYPSYLPPASLDHNAKFSGWYIGESGCGRAATYHPAQAHDKITISNFTKQCIIQKAAEMYASGYSLAAIATELDAAKTTVRQTLIAEGVSLRSHSNRQLTAPASPKSRSVKTAPYGFCMVGGRLAEDPREMAVVQLMLGWWRSGMSLCAIARRLNSQKIKPRKAAKWSQPTVGFIIQRQQSAQPK